VAPSEAETRSLAARRHAHELAEITAGVVEAHVVAVSVHEGPCVALLHSVPGWACRWAPAQRRSTPGSGLARFAPDSGQAAG
jgi:hypothetical protein